MNLVLVGSNLVLWFVVLVLAFLLLGALRALGLLNWRLDQLELTRPSRIGRDGLQPGQRAPDFTLPLASGGNRRNHSPHDRSPHDPREADHLAERDVDDQVALYDFAARRVMLVFVQCGCGPCHDIAPELNRLTARNGNVQVLAIIHAAPDDARQWVADTGARFPVLIQQDWSVSKAYESFATPFAFVIDEGGFITAKGIVSQRQHLSYLLSASAAYCRTAPQPDCPHEVAAGTTPS